MYAIRSYYEGEFRDRAYLNLPGKQEELIKKVASTGKPVIVVLVGGSAITIRITSYNVCYTKLLRVEGYSRWWRKK